MPLPPSGLGCAAQSRESAEPLCGTAPTATAGWLLIEHSGPWPGYGYPPDLPAPLAAAADWLLRFGVRPQLIRRTDRVGRRGDGVRAIFLVGGADDGVDGAEGAGVAGGTGGTGHGIAGGAGHGVAGRWIERVDPELLTDRQALRRLGPDTFRSPRRPGLGRSQGPLLLVCTHGRREVCCARYGRPVAVALVARFGSAVWETTHVGGDRFAANLVLLPGGAYFGRLDPDHAVKVAELALGGELDLDAYRGTAGRSEAAQSAEWHLRRALDEPRIGAVRALPPHPADAAHPHRFARGHERYSVIVEPYTYPDPRLLSCAEGVVQPPRGHRLVSITVEPPPVTSGG